MRVFHFIFIIVLSSSLSASVFGSAHLRQVPTEFSVKEYEDFHRVLHPLEHEALPKKDFARIRAAAPEFVALGEAIVKLGVPSGTKPADVAEFEKELKKFREALAKFAADAKSGRDSQLESSFSAVHDSFEMLAGLLPRSTAQATLRPMDRLAIANTAVVVYDGIATGITRFPGPSNDLWLTTSDLMRATRFVIKPQGVCRDQLCFPLPKSRKNEFVNKQGSTTWFNLSEFARLIKQPFVTDLKNGVWYFGALPEGQNSYIASLEAPDFTLPDLNGKQHSLREFRGKKVLLVTWASW